MGSLLTELSYRDLVKRLKKHHFRFYREGKGWLVFNSKTENIFEKFGEIGKFT